MRLLSRASFTRTLMRLLVVDFVVLKAGGRWCNAVLEDATVALGPLHHLTQLTLSELAALTATGSRQVARFTSDGAGLLEVLRHLLTLTR